MLSRKQRLFLYAAILAVVAGGLIVNHNRRVIKRVGHTHMANARNLSLACTVHANFIGYEAYPNTLYELEMHPDAPSVLPFREPRTQKLYDWLYFKPASPSDTSNTNFILIASPTTVDQRGFPLDEDEMPHRIVAYINNRTDIIEESDFKRLIASQYTPYAKLHGNE